MQLEVQHRPRSRGVSQLMYVGDDEAVETATNARPIVIAGVIALVAWALLRRK